MEWVEDEEEIGQMTMQVEYAVVGVNQKSRLRNKERTSLK